MSWWRKNWRWLLAAVVATAGVVVLCFLFALRRRAEVEDLRAQLALMKAGAKVEGLRAERKARKTELARNDHERKSLENALADARRQAVATVREVDEMSDDDIATEFRNLGY